MKRHKNQNMKWIGLIILLCVLAWSLDYVKDDSSGADNRLTIDAAQHFKTPHDDTDKIAAAFAAKQSDVQVQAKGKVIAVLADDNEGSRHQKFILALNQGQTILVAHNIDLAPRIQHLKKGDEVEFLGEYEYSAKGGVVHWTHHDPAQKHADGWLKHGGKTYQ